MASNPPMVGAATLMSAQASANCPTVTVPLGAQPPSGGSPRRRWRIHKPVWIWMPFQPRCSRPPAAASPPSTGTSIQLFAGGPVAWFPPSVAQGNPAVSRARAEFKFHCQMLEDLVIGAQELGNGLDVGRPRRLDTRQVHLPVNAPGGLLTVNALVLPVFPGRAVKAALDESQAVASVRGDDIGARKSWRAGLVTSVGGARVGATSVGGAKVGYATAGGGGKAGNGGGGSDGRQ